MSLQHQFWAKTFGETGDDRTGAASKSVLHHLIDVAAVAFVFLVLNEPRLLRESALAGLTPDCYARLAALLAGLHDLGKFSAAFQFKAKSLWPVCLGPRPEKPPFDIPHWRVTAMLLRQGNLQKRFRSFFPNLGGSHDEALIAAIAGHHGRPPPFAGDEHSPSPLHRDMELAAAAEAFDALATLTGASAAPGIDEDRAPLLSWRLSGLVTLADWVGSDQAFFGPVVPNLPIDAYWKDARGNARRALHAKGLIAFRPNPKVSLGAISPRAAAAPRPMQTLVNDVSLGEGPNLFLIEDATGSGKTEAAVLLAARLMAAGKGEGIYVALPTMATANAMHRRAEDFVSALFEAPEDGCKPSLVLAHGKAALAHTLEAATTRREEPGELTAAASCNEWIADERRRAFFADFGTGTIDQAFLAVLPKKHLTLRQYALAGRILIIDEAHCFDAYMKEELGVLLRLHAMNGGSAIVLSATLSVGARRNTAAAFLRGLRLSEKKAKTQANRCKSLEYPLLTRVDASGVLELDRNIAPGLAREVFVCRLDNRSAALGAACEAADRGAAVLILCNAVDEAIGVHGRLRETKAPDKVHLFHARFAQCDRIAIEDDVLARFGREPERQRSGHILVATQVVEQSLDLDFDLVISDLAPVDLLIQRAGRLWRHLDLRPAASRPVAGPAMMVVCPDPDAVTQADWLGPCLGKAAAVYQHAGIMWRSAKVIFGKGSFSVPGDLRPMIEAVYGKDAEPVPDVLKPGEVRGSAKDDKGTALGRFNTICLETGYGALPMDLRADEEIGTRLQDDETVTVRLARRRNGALVPWCIDPGLPLHVLWALSEVTLRKKTWGEAKPLEEDARLHEATRRAWTEWEQSIALAEVLEGGALRLRDVCYFYSAERGLNSISPGVRG